MARWKEVEQGGRVRSTDEVLQHLPEWEAFRPTLAQAEAASKFRGRVNEDTVRALMGGKFAEVTTRLVAVDVVKQWRPNTWSAKQAAVAAFFAFMEAVGTVKRFFPGRGHLPEKTIDQVRAEEHMLCHFAIVRCMAG